MCTLGWFKPYFPIKPFILNNYINSFAMLVQNTYDFEDATNPKNDQTQVKRQASINLAPRAKQISAEALCRG